MKLKYGIFLSKDSIKKLQKDINICVFDIDNKGQLSLSQLKKTFSIDLSNK